MIAPMQTGNVGIVLPPSVTSIEEMCFFGNKTIQFIDLSRCAHLKYVSKKCFKGTSGLRCVVLGPSIEIIQESAFEDSGVTNVNLQDTRVRSIGSHAFAGCLNLQYICLPRTMLVMAHAAFARCKAAGVIDMGQCRYLTRIMDLTFYLCVGATRVRLPPCVKTIHMNAFYQCHKVAAWHLPPTLESVGSFAFAALDAPQHKFKRTIYVHGVTPPRFHKNALMNSGLGVATRAGLAAFKYGDYLRVPARAVEDTVARTEFLLAARLAGRRSSVGLPHMPYEVWCAIFALNHVFGRRKRTAWHLPNMERRSDECVWAAHLQRPLHCSTGAVIPPLLAYLLGLGSRASLISIGQDIGIVSHPHASWTKRRFALQMYVSECGELPRSILAWDADQQAESIAAFKATLAAIAVAEGPAGVKPLPF
jgi:hypothetical protein